MVVGQDLIRPAVDGVGEAEPDHGDGDLEPVEDLAVVTGPGQLVVSWEYADSHGPDMEAQVTVAGPQQDGDPTVTVTRETSVTLSGLTSRGGATYDVTVVAFDPATNATSDPVFEGDLAVAPGPP